MINAQAINKAELSFVDYNSERERYEIKYHTTVMNAAHKDKKEKGIRHSFNAQRILDKYGKFQLGTVELDTIQLCSIHEKDPETGFYKALTKIELITQSVLDNWN